MKEPLKTMLESGAINTFIWAYVGSVFLLHQYLYGANELKNDSFIYKHFGRYADTLFGIATYGLAGTTSTALLKGLYLQTFYSGMYFTGFGTFDLVSMFLLTSFLLVYSMFNTSMMLRTIIYHTETVEITVKSNLTSKSR
ncbi:hypothetical protein [Parendozoicomonas sp. Alg238-R29]|uniref:hypothetical protein n=1 Tax=Parendozoicomonas sp. Alg238-R29 TaxID=2993446 RepID=UPI00248EF456|nr:hypothetical protein [Parendozoicomonas sp. Alg238-R29]